METMNLARINELTSEIVELASDLDDGDKLDELRHLRQVLHRITADLDTWTHLDED